MGDCRTKDRKKWRFIAPVRGSCRVQRRVTGIFARFVPVFAQLCRLFAKGCGLLALIGPGVLRGTYLIALAC